MSDAALDFGAGGELSGSTGCNRLGGTWEGGDGELSITIGPITLAGCLDPQVADQETAVIAGLEATVSYDGGEEQLSLLDGDGNEVLLYAAVTQDLTGTSWQATGINNGTGVETNANTGLATIEFADDGTAGGSGGCNGFTASWEAGDGTITITELEITEMSCGPDLDAMEQQYVTALGAATTYAVSGSTLELRDDGGALQVAYAVAR